MRHSFDFSHIEAVMVDLDGTMVDTMGDFEAALNLCLADIDLPKVSPSVVNIAVGIATPTGFARGQGLRHGV
jgi:phosphoglycolate phosphatase